MTGWTGFFSEDWSGTASILINLIGNAVKFTADGEVRLRVASRRDLLEFTVSDTGIGIPEDRQSILFESFSQVDGSFTRSYGGTGLGLAISKGLVGLMGGEISVRSREAEGSDFTFTVPMKTSADPSSASTDLPDREIEETPTSSVLLAEDDPMIREVISAVMKKRGWQIETSKNGREALELWKNGNFSVILMDLQMPEMDGIEATRAIRERESKEKRRCCIIGLTAHARAKVREECLGAGMDEVLTKPFQSEDLFSVIRGCL